MEGQVSDVGTMRFEQVVFFVQVNMFDAVRGRIAFKDHRGPSEWFCNNVRKLSALQARSISSVPMLRLQLSWSGVCIRASLDKFHFLFRAFRPRGWHLDEAHVVIDG